MAAWHGVLGSTTNSCWAGGEPGPGSSGALQWLGVLPGSRAAQLWAQLPADAAVGGLNAAQGALIYHLPPPPSDSGLDVCFVPRRGVSPDRGLL